MYEDGGSMFMCALEREVRVQPGTLGFETVSHWDIRLGGLTSEPRDLPASASPAGLQVHHHAQLFFMGLED